MKFFTKWFRKFFPPFQPRKDEEEQLLLSALPGLPDEYAKKAPDEQHVIPDNGESEPLQREPTKKQQQWLERFGNHNPLTIKDIQSTFNGLFVKYAISNFEQVCDRTFFEGKEFCSYLSFPGAQVMRRLSALSFDDHMLLVECVIDEMDKERHIAEREKREQSASRFVKSILLHHFPYRLPKSD